MFPTTLRLVPINSWGCRLGEIFMDILTDKTWYEALISRLDEADKAETAEAAGIWQTLKQRVNPLAEQPQANAHVIVRELQDRRGQYLVLKNTEAKTYLRLSPTEYKLFTQMDGRTSVQELIVNHFMETGEFAHATVINLVRQLHANSMLSEAPIDAWNQLARAAERRSLSYWLSKPAQMILTQPLAIPGVDRMVTLLYRLGGWLWFTRPAQILFFLISLSGLIAFMLVVNDDRYQFIGQNFLVGLAWLWVASLLPVIIHELGHALTVKHYGREVPRGGLMLYFGMPAAFVETTDIWLEPRRARLATTWNGPYTGLILGGAAALCMFFWPGLAINSFLFKLAGFAYTTVFLNINPLLKFDGYYLLSDALDIPALQERSLAFVRHKLPQYIGQRRKLTREEWVFAVYGVLSIAWVFVAIYLALFFWRARVQQGLQALVGENYPLFARVMGILLVATMVSLALVLLLGFIRLIRTSIARDVSAGGLARHWRLALIGAILALAIGSAVPLLFANYTRLLSPALAAIALWLAAVRLLLFNHPYLGSRRGLLHLVFALMLIIIGLSQGVRAAGELSLVTNAVPLTTLMRWANGLQLAGMVLLLGEGVLTAWPPTPARQGQLGYLIGIIAGAGWLVGLILVGGILPGNLQLWLSTALIVVGFWATMGPWGGARPPSIALRYAGGVILILSGLVSLRAPDLPLTGSLLLAASALHLVYARLPQLSNYDIRGIAEARQAIGASAAVIVRRIIAQLFFESGWRGVARLGKQFSAAMQSQGAALSISGNQFEDEELPKRTASELTEVYGLAFDELHRLLQRELGREMGTLAFAYGVDRLPWENREIVAELILSRRPWALSLQQEVQDTRLSRRNLLKRVPLFATLTDEDLDQIARRLRTQRFAAGAVILHQGEAGDTFHIVQSGIVTIWQKGAEGLDQKIDQKGPGQYFGEAALVSDRPRNATARALTPVVLLSLSKGEFDRLVRQYVSLGENVDYGCKYGWLLRSMPIFDELNSQQLDWLSQQLHAESFAPGQVIFREGERGDKFYMVESGRLAVSRQINGTTTVIDQVGPGQYVGEIALLQDRPRTATITAIEETMLLSLEAEAFHKLVAGYGHLSQTVSKAGSRRMAHLERADLLVKEVVTS